MVPGFDWIPKITQAWTGVKSSGFDSIPMAGDQQHGTRCTCAQASHGPVGCAQPVIQQPQMGTHQCVHVHMRACMCACVRVLLHTSSTPVCESVSPPACVRVRVRECARACLCVRACVRACVCALRAVRAVPCVPCRACVRACVPAYMRTSAVLLPACACMHARVPACAPACGGAVSGPVRCGGAAVRQCGGVRCGAVRCGTYAHTRRTDK